VTTSGSTPTRRARRARPSAGRSRTASTRWLLAPALLAHVLPLDGFAMVVNYGLDRLRFPAPLPTGEQVRMRVRLDTVEPVPGGAALSLNLTFERASGGKPVCVANALFRVYEQR
jgi:acyl dehydratase